MQERIADNTPWFDARTTTCGTTRIVAVGGELDLAVAPWFEAAVAGALAHEPRTVVVDLSAVDFMDSSGVHVLLSVHRRAAAQSMRLVVVPGPAPVQRLLSVCGVDSVLAFSSAESAPC